MNDVITERDAEALRHSPPETTGSSFSDASPEAKRLAATILEVLAGCQGPSEAARWLGISLARYYQLEARALSGLVSSCEARRRGGRRPRNELTALQQECEQLRRECARQQALARATRRSIGLLPASPNAASPVPDQKCEPKRRGRRPASRALRMAAQLKTAEARPAVAASTATTCDPPASPHGDSCEGVARCSSEDGDRQ